MFSSVLPNEESNVLQPEEINRLSLVRAIAAKVGAFSDNMTDEELR